VEGYRTATIAALELLPMYLVHGGAPTLYFRLQDRVGSALLDSAHAAASCACRRAIEAFGRWESGVEEEMCRMRLTLAAEVGEHVRGPIRSVLRMREEHNRRLLEEGCSTIERLLIEKDIL
jgi:hypothetical protein